jgi:hypothetical protein
LGSDREDRQRHRSKKHRSRSREISSAPGATGLGYAAHKYSQHKDRRKSEECELFRKIERKKEVSRKRFRSCSDDDDDDAPRGRTRTRTRYNQDLISHAVSDVGETARGDGQSEEESSSHKCRRMKSPYRELRKSAEYDKVNLGATLTPKIAKEDISLSSAIDRAMEETLEGLVLQWTNLTREEIQIE